MKFSDVHTEAAYSIAAVGCAEQEVGVRSEVDDGPMWQALVRCSRTNLMRARIGDQAYWKAIKPGHETLVWLVEDEPGHVIAHKTTDCDLSGYRERIAEMTASFEAVTAHYSEEPDESVDFGDYVSTDTGGEQDAASG